MYVSFTNKITISISLFLKKVTNTVIAADKEIFGSGSLYTLILRDVLHTKI